jgi:hypothetical protein
MLKKLKKLEASPQKTIQMMKFIFVLSNKNTPNFNANLAFSIAESIVGQPWTNQKGE